MSTDFVIEIEMDAPLGGPFSEDCCGLRAGDLNMLARRYQRERSLPAKEAHSKAERVEEREMGSIPAKEVRAQLATVMNTAAKLQDRLATLNPKAKRALQAKAEQRQNPQLIESLDFLLEVLMVVTRDAEQSYDPTNGGTTYNAHGPGANNSALTNLVRLVAGLLEQQHRPVSHSEAGDLYRLVSTVLVWNGDGRTECLSESIRKALERA